MGEDYRQQFAQQFPQFALDFYTEDAVKAHAVALDDLRRKSGGSGPSSLSRDAYAVLGYDDNAMPLDQTLHDRLVSDYEGQTRHHEGGNHCQFADLDDEELDESFIGRKWIAVVDYHSYGRRCADSRTPATSQPLTPQRRPYAASKGEWNSC
jgi:hypothetical protein